MEESVLTKIVLPAALGIIMLGLGLSLTIADFTRVVKYPKAVFIGLLCQMLILPFAAFFIARFFNLPGELAVGLMLLAASPGGATANLFSHLSNGDVALNITLTAINSVLTLFTLPFIVGFSVDYFMGSSADIAMPFKKVIEVFAIVLVPVTIGMFIKSRNAALTKRLERPVRIASAVLLVLVIVAAIIKERVHMAEYFQSVGVAALLFNLVSMLSGYFIPRLLKVENRQAIAIGMEIGIHNGTLAIFIAVTVLKNSAMSIPPAVYSLIMFFTAATFGMMIRGKKE